MKIFFNNTGKINGIMRFLIQVPLKYVAEHVSVQVVLTRCQIK